MLPYIITQLFPNVKFFPAQGGSYKEILHFVHCLAHFAYRSMWRFGTMSKTYSRMKIIPPHQSRKRLMRGDKSALFIEIIFQPKWNDPCVVPRNPSAKRARQPHSAASPYLPKRQKLPPESTRTVQSETTLCHVQAGALGGKFSVSEGGLEGESPVFQEGALSLQGLPIPPRKSSHNNHHTCA